MAGARVNVTNAQVIAALNTPGGAVYAWRDNTARTAVRNAVASAPVNDAQNRRHRPEDPGGTYKRSFGWDRLGSNGHRVRARIYNTAEHAIFVELGRGPSMQSQTFSWTGWGGEIRTVSATRARRGRHVLARAVNAAVRRNPGIPTP